MSAFRKFEKRLRDLVEGSLDDIFQAKFAPQRMASMLLDVLQEHVQVAPDGRKLAPDRYYLFLHPNRARRLLEESPDIIEYLQSVLHEFAAGRTLSFLDTPEILLVEDPSTPERSLHIEVDVSNQAMDETQEMVFHDENRSTAPPMGAFIILDGRRHVSLQTAVVQIGRRQTNDLVIDDPQASRIHAQLRVMDNRFVLFDLGSTHGTWVNNRKVRQHILQTGDVIRIGATQLVYGEDPSDSGDVTPTYNPSTANPTNQLGPRKRTKRPSGGQGP